MQQTRTIENLDGLLNARLAIVGKFFLLKCGACDTMCCRETFGD